MIPTESIGIGEIHHIKLTQKELVDLIKQCPYTRFEGTAASYYSGPMYEKQFKQMQRGGLIGKEKPWYS